MHWNWFQLKAIGRHIGCFSVSVQLKYWSNMKFEIVHIFLFPVLFWNPEGRFVFPWARSLATFLAPPVVSMPERAGGSTDTTPDCFREKDPRMQCVDFCDAKTQHKLTYIVMGWQDHERTDRPEHLEWTKSVNDAKCRSGMDHRISWCRVLKILNSRAGALQISRQESLCLWGWPTTSVWPGRGGAGGSMTRF